MLQQYTGGHHQNVTSHGAMAAASTFSFFFPLPKGQQWPPQVEDAAAYSYDDHSTVTTSPSSPASSSSTGSVDCTLSLGTPSSRRRAEPEAKHAGAPQPCPSVSAAAALSWDPAAECYYYQQGKLGAGAAAATRGAVGHDQLLDRRCANCGTSSTPLWRNGPRGPKSLCNACGIRFKKEERRAAESGGGGGGGGAGAECGYTAQRAHGSAAPVPPRAVPMYGEEADAEGPFLAWQLNVVPPAPAFSVWPERASLYQYN